MKDVSLYKNTSVYDHLPLKLKMKISNCLFIGFPSLYESDRTRKDISRLHLGAISEFLAFVYEVVKEMPPINYQ